MASEAGRRLTELHRRAQLQVGTQVVEQMRAAYRLLDLDDLDGTFEDWLAVVAPLVRAGRRRSTLLALQYLLAFRAAETGRSSSDLRLVAPRPIEPRRLATSLLVTGPAAIRAAVARGVALQRAAEVAQARTAAAAMRHSLDAGRETLTETVRADPRALGWARVASVNACAFCAMLAGRGPHYRSEETAGFEAHDGCACSVEPTYERDSWPAGSRDMAELWKASTTGLSGGDARKAFRSALAQRRAGYVGEDGA